MNPDTKKLRDMMKDFRSAMLVTLDGTGSPRARPMNVVSVENDAELWFVTGDDSGKVDELERDRRCAVTMQSSVVQVSVTGRAFLVEDRQKIDELWNKTWDVWFEGKDDPRIALLRVVPEKGEYWDQTGTKGARFLWEAAKTLATGRHHRRGQGRRPRQDDHVSPRRAKLASPRALR